MSIAYDLYLQDHRANVAKGLKWFEENLPQYIYNPGIDANKLAEEHDKSKYDPEEYDAYDNYFYGRNRSFAVVEYFNKAWLRHIHNNPHHWQHWVLINDDPKWGETCIEMPQKYVMEMICDWWAFSWAKDNLYEIFSWYDEHKAYMKLSDKTRKTVEDILGMIKRKLDESKE